MQLTPTVLAVLVGCVSAFTAPGGVRSSPSVTHAGPALGRPEPTAEPRGWTAAGAAAAAGLGLAAVGLALGRSARGRTSPVARGPFNVGIETRTDEKAMTGKIVGVTLPLTEKFDPLNFSDTDEKLERYTAVEIKHGRIAMIATIGYIVPEFGRFPGCEDFKHGLGALSTIPAEGIFQLVLFLGAHEVLIKPRAGGMGPWDFGFGTELLSNISEDELIRRQNVERNNGRLAMIGIIGMMWQDGTFGLPPIAYGKINGLWGGSLDKLVNKIPCTEGIVAHKVPKRMPLTAMRGTRQGELAANKDYQRGTINYGGISKRDPMKVLRGEEIKMSPAVPFLEYPEQLDGWVGGEKGFDPLGVTNALPVYLVREAELKHGRVCMLAVTGWIATDLGVRFPADVFQGVSTLEAHDKMVEAGYMLPFLLTCGVIEIYGLWLLFQGFALEIDREAGDFFIGKQFLPKDPAKEREMRLKELENGRLAMLAFSGIQTAAVLTQKPWPFL